MTIDTTAMQTQAPAPKTIIPLSTGAIIPQTELPLSLQILFDQALFERVKDVARYMALASGFLPAHLVGNPSACFAVAQRALAWRLDFYAVAQSTYAITKRQKIKGTANDWEEVVVNVGFMGNLCHAIIENSGRLDPDYGGVKFEYYGPWEKVRSKFRIVTRQDTDDRGEARGKPKRVPEQLWTDDDELTPDSAGKLIGVKVTAKLKGEQHPRSLEFDMASAQPRNSSQWITAPARQICNTSVRAFGNLVVPHLFMGIPFDREDWDDWGDRLKDVTPLQQSGPLVQVQLPTVQTEPNGHDTAEPEKPFFMDDTEGVTHSFADPTEAADFFRGEMEHGLKARGANGIEAAWLNGARLIYELRKAGCDEIAEALHQTYQIKLGEADAKEHKSSRAAETDEPRTDQPGAALAQDADQSTGTAREAPVKGIVGRDDFKPPAMGAAGSQDHVTAAAALQNNNDPHSVTALAEDLQHKLEEKATENFRERNLTGIDREAKLAARTADPPSKVYDVSVPPIDEKNPTAWFAPANQKLVDMLDADLEADDFRRYRRVNEASLAIYKKANRSWHDNYLELKLQQGEKRKGTRK